MSKAGARVLVVGYGNTLRGDDGVGVWIAEQLAERLDPDRARVIVTHQLTPELAETLSHWDRAILIDARADAAPGELSARWLSAGREGTGGESGEAFSHHFTPGALLAMARRLFGHAPETLLIGIGVESTGLNMALTEKVAATARGVVEDFDHWLTLPQQ